MQVAARLKQAANDYTSKASSAVAQAAPPAEQAAAESSEIERARGQVLDAALQPVEPLRRGCGHGRGGLVLSHT